MPKEVIQTDGSYGDTDAPEDVFVELHWGREASYVQLATTLMDKSTHVRLRREVDGGWFANLNRQSLNDLIRKLRRARDQAFGADE